MVQTNDKIVIRFPQDGLWPSHWQGKSVAVKIVQLADNDGYSWAFSSSDENSAGVLEVVELSEFAKTQDDLITAQNKIRVLEEERNALHGKAEYMEKTQIPELRGEIAKASNLAFHSEAALEKAQERIEVLEQMIADAGEEGDQPAATVKMEAESIISLLGAKPKKMEFTFD
jgi:hypothetical protein